MTYSKETFIDLRSDTVTHPTDEMRRAMAEARVGDDVLGDDPTVVELERRAASMLGKEAALFFPSGTMANLTALMAHAQPGGEVYVGAHSHIYYYEVGGLARLAGLVPCLFDDEGGMPEPESVRALLRPDNIHFPAPALLCLENTHNRAGGTVATPADTAGVAAIGREAGIRVHLDGARLFNAAAALEVDVKHLAQPVDSVMVSLSKALSAPIGSLLAGSDGFIAAARRVRKLLGGGMRQVGVIAAAGLIALDTPAEALRAEHGVAAALAEGLARIDGIEIDASRVQTNIVLFRLTTDVRADAFVQRLQERGVGAVSMAEDQVRFVTNRHVTGESVPDVLAAVQAAL